MQAKIWVPILVILAFVGGWFGHNAYQKSQKPAPSIMEQAQVSDNDSLPAVTLPDFNGKQVNLADMKGKVLVINLWAAWCPPCRKEMPEFVALQKELGPKGVQFVGIGVDEEGALRAFAQQVGVNYPTLLAGDQGDQMLATFGDVQGVLPFTVVVDRQGRIRTRHPGYFPQDELRRQLSPLM